MSKVANFSLSFNIEEINAFDQFKVTTRYPDGIETVFIIELSDIKYIIKSIDDKDLPIIVELCESDNGVHRFMVYECTGYLNIVMTNLKYVNIYRQDAENLLGMFRKMVE